MTKIPTFSLVFRHHNVQYQKFLNTKANAKTKSQIKILHKRNSHALGKSVQKCNILCDI